LAKKKNKRKKNKPSAPSGRQGAVPAPEPSGKPQGKSKGKLIFYAVLAAAIVAGGGFIWQSNQAVTAFDKTAVLGKSKLSSVITERNDGRGHYEFDHQANFPGRFPTSGQHNQRWTEPGFYEEPQNAGKLVHALEHGNIVIYYDTPGSKALALLKQWSNLFQGQWSGVVVVPAPGLGEKIVLSAWQKKLQLKPLAESPAAAFIDTYRGRGPEHPVR